MIEKQQVEYKSIWKKEILEEICGAANAKGGKFLIGKDNSGKTIGMSEKEADNLMTLIPNQIVQTMHFYDVTVDTIEDEDGLLYIELDVQKASTPVFYQGKMYKRIGSSNFLVEGKEQQNALIEVRNKSWDSTFVEGVTIEDLDSESFEIFREEALNTGMLKGRNLDSPEKILEGLELIRDGKLTTAAVLLFHKQPHKIIPGAYVQIGKMRNDADVVAKDEIKGSLMILSRSILDILKLKYLYALISYDMPTRIETYPYPFDALREAIFNSLMHNDWSAGQPILIKVYDHKLSILNRSILEAGWTVENHKPRHINSLISIAFSKAGLVEKFGTGISKIIDACTSEGNPKPIFEPASDGLDFSVTFKASKLYLALEEYRKKLNPEGGFVDYRKVLASIKSDTDAFRSDTGFIKNDTSITENDTGIKLHDTGKDAKYRSSIENCKKIYHLIKDNPLITYSQIATKLMISRSTVSRAISVLKDSGYIKSNDKNRSGEWKILKEYPDE